MEDTNLPPQPQEPIQSATPTPTQPAKSIPKLVFLLLILLLLSIVAYTAYSYGKNYSTKISPSPQPLLASPIVVSTPDPTAGWKIISRKNWSFKVPANWNYLECGDDLIFAGPNINKDKTIQCAFDSSPGLIQISKADDMVIIDVNEGSIEVPEKETKIISGKEALVRREITKDGQGAGDRYVAYIPANFTSITLHDAKEKEIFDQILSTFKFLDNQTDTLNWKTYINENWRISFK